MASNNGICNVHYCHTNQEFSHQCVCAYSQGLNTEEDPQNTTGEQPVNNVSIYDRLGRKTQELFPELSRNGSRPLERYLYSSQAQRAYEATWLMSWSLVQVLWNNGNFSQVEWLEMIMVCGFYSIFTCTV